MPNDSRTGISDATSSRRQILKATGTGVAASFVTLSGCVGGDDGNGGGDGNNDGGGGNNGDGDVTEDDLADSLTFMEWGGNFGEVAKTALVEPFRQEHDIEVEFVPLPAPSEMLSKLQAGTLGVDVVSHWNYTVYQGVQNDLFQPIRTENVPNLDKVIEGYRPAEVDYDPGDQPHHIPNTIGGNGLAYNSDEIDEPSSWDDIFTEDMADQVAIPGWMATSTGIAAKAAGQNLDDSLPDNMDQVWGKLEEWDQYMFDWWSSGQDMQNYLLDGSVYGGMLWWARTYGLIQDEDAPLSYTIPEDGTNAWVETYTIPHTVTGQKRRTAEYFLNWIYKEEQLQNLVNEMPYAIPYDWEETPDVYDDHPEQEYLGTDRIEPWSSTVLEENRQEWSTKFRQIISG